MICYILYRAWGTSTGRETTVKAVEVVGIGGAVTDARDRVHELLEAFTARRSMTTRKAYETDLEDFTRYTETGSVPSAVWSLISDGPGHANTLALHYKGGMIASGKSPATVNRRLSALRSVVSMARTLGLVSWSLEVGNEKARSYRDTRGPGRQGVRSLLDAIEGDGPKAIRDRAIVRLMYDLALRRGEIVTLRLEDVDLEGRRVWIAGKGRNGEREGLTLPDQTAHALAAWITVRGTEAGPLFRNYHHDRMVQAVGGITGAGLYYLVRSLGVKVGVSTRPHGIRHAAITEALDRHDAREVQRFSRHADMATVMRYDDNREDLAGKVAGTVAAGL